MDFNIRHILFICFIFLIANPGHVTAVTDAELEALEKQIEQQEVEAQRRAEEVKKEAEAKRKKEAAAKANRLEEERIRKAEEEKRLAEPEKQRQGEEQKKLEAQKRIDEEKRKAEEARLAELERQRREEEIKKKAEEEKRLFELEKEKLRVENLKEEQQKVRNRITQAILGEWQSDYGTIVFRETDNGQIDGKYYFFFRDGRLIGSLEGNTLSGLWLQSGALRSCSEAREGTKKWGNFSFQFIDDYTKFIGKWGYCDEEQDSNWNGKKTK